MEFNFKKLKFKYGETQHELRYPTTGEIEDFGTVADAEKPMESTYLLLEKLGLSRDAARDMQHEHLMQVVNEIANPKKN